MTTVIVPRRNASLTVAPAARTTAPAAGAPAARTTATGAPAADATTSPIGTAAAEVEGGETLPESIDILLLIIIGGTKLIYGFKYFFFNFFIKD